MTDFSQMLSEQHLLGLFIKAIPLIFAALFPVVNPIGSAILLLPYTGPIDDATRKLIARKVARNTFLILTIVLLAGRWLLAFFGISVPVVQLAGGLVVASLGWDVLRGGDSPAERAEAPRPSADSLLQQTFYPFTFPVTVGPGSVAVTLTLSAHIFHAELPETLVSQAGALVGFLALAVTVFLSFAYTVPLLHRVGPAGTKVIIRLMAFVLLCIGAQIAWSGASGLIASLPHR